MSGETYRARVASKVLRSVQDGPTTGDSNFRGYHLIYIIGFVLLGTIGIAMFYGVDHLVERVKVDNRAPWPRAFLG